MARDAIALAMSKDHLRLRGTFDVHVQLGFGYGAQQFRQAFGGDGGRFMGVFRMDAAV